MNRVVLYPKYIENILVLFEFIIQHFNLSSAVKFQLSAMGGLKEENV